MAGVILSIVVGFVVIFMGLILFITDKRKRNGRKRLDGAIVIFSGLLTATVGSYIARRIADTEDHKTLIRTTLSPQAMTAKEFLMSSHSLPLSEAWWINAGPEKELFLTKVAAELRVDKEFLVRHLSEEHVMVSHQCPPGYSTSNDLDRKNFDILIQLSPP